MKKEKRETGSVMLEFALGVVFLVPTIFIMIDLGKALNQYAKVARITYEGARYASAVAGLEGGGPYRTDSNQPIPPQQALLQQRLTILVNMNFQSGTMPPTMVLATSYNKRDLSLPEGTQANPDIITVRIETSYHPMTPFLPTVLPMSIETSGPYLYRQRS